VLVIIGGHFETSMDEEVKAVLACAADNDALEGHLEPAQSKVKRREAPQLLMIGLAISVVAINLLLTRREGALRQLSQ